MNDVLFPTPSDQQQAAIAEHIGHGPELIDFVGVTLAPGLRLDRPGARPGVTCVFLHAVDNGSTRFEANHRDLHTSHSVSRSYEMRAEFDHNNVQFARELLREDGLPREFRTEATGRLNRM
jgi:hypothetical protein